MDTANSRYMVMKEMVEESKISRFTLALRLSEGKLHGTQNGTRGRWRVHRSCFEAFMVGEQCEHQAKAKVA